MLIISVHVIGSGFCTNDSYLGIHGWDYYWGYKQLAFFCLNANLICISFFLAFVDNDKWFYNTLLIRYINAYCY